MLSSTDAHIASDSKTMGCQNIHDDEHSLASTFFPDSSVTRTSTVSFIQHTY